MLYEDAYQGYTVPLTRDGGIIILTDYILYNVQYQELHIP